MEHDNNSNERRNKEVLSILENEYPDAAPELNYQSPFQLLIAVILSAQTTDRHVNNVTPVLFNRLPDANAFAIAPVEQIEELIKSCGFYKTKAKNIKNTCSILANKYNGEVPDEINALMALPGVGRKTANVVLSNAFGIDAIAVDTHVYRVSNRIGLANADNEYKTEQQLMENIPKNKWSKAHHWLIFHGRRICKARNPLCSKCPIALLCDYFRVKN